MSNFEEWNKQQHAEHGAHQDRSAEHANSAWKEMHLLRERAQQGTTTLPHLTIEDNSRAMPRTDIGHVAGTMLHAAVHDNQTRSHINEVQGQWRSNITQHNNYQQLHELPAAGFRSYIHGNEVVRNRR